MSRSILIVGCGSMGREHIENINALPGARVTAIADPYPDSKAAAELRAAYDEAKRLSGFTTKQVSEVG